MRDRLSEYFQLADYGTTVSREVLAGVSTFLATAYILVVHPAILSEAGMNKTFVLFATIVASALATLTMGLWARLPFVLAPGLEMSIYVAFVVVGTLGFSWQQALGAVFWSGVLFLILTVTKVRQKIIETIPHPMRSGIAFCVGLFIALIALRTAGLLEYEGTAPSGFGSFVGPGAVALYVSTGLILLLERLGVRAAVLVSIVATTFLYHTMEAVEGGEEAIALSGDMLAGTGRLDLAVLLEPRMWSVIVLLFVIDFYGSIAKFIGLTMQTNLVRNGELPRITRALGVDGAATMFGAGVGTTSITTFVESGVGIGAGGRTGLTAVVCGVLTLACFGIAPLVHYVPIEATTGALIYVAVKLSPKREVLRGYTWVDLFALGLMSVIVVATFALDRAMLAGFVIYTVAGLGSALRSDPGRREMPSRYLVLSVLILLLGTALQLL